MSIATLVAGRTTTGLGRFVENRVAAGALAVLAVAVLAAAFAPLLAPQNPYDLSQLNIMDASLPPGSRGTDGMLYLLGTDDQGRDLVSAILYGLRTSLVVALVSGAIAMTIGGAVGIAAAYYGGWVDSLLMRLVDVQLAFPSILVALVLLAVFGPGLDKVIFGIVAAQWAIYARTVRGAAQVERRKEYIAAAHVLVFRPWRIMLRHMMPNSVSDLGVVATVEVANAIALEATLSFLGVGLPVTQPSLGLLIANGYSYMLAGQIWLSAAPGLVLLLVVFSVNIVGDRLRQLHDPLEAA